jgi:hypothetical protein
MRTGSPSASTKRSSGLAGQPSGMPSSGVLGWTASGPCGGLAQGGIGRGKGALWRKPPGRSMVPSRVMSTPSARMVWKPLEWAAMPAHGMEGDRIAGHRRMLVVPAVGPGDRQLDLLVARGDAHLMRESRMVSAGIPVISAAHSGVQGSSRSLSSWKAGLTGIPSSMSSLIAAHQARIRTRGVGADGTVDIAVPPELVLGIETALFDVHLGAIEETVIVARRIIDDQLGRVGIADQEVAIEQTLLEDLVRDGHQQGAVGAGLDRHPFVGDGRVAGADRVDRDEASAAALELGDGDLQRVGMMILGGADHHEELGAVQIRSAELPEGAADGVDHARGHVDRAEAAMCRIVRRAELLGEETGQGLHLIATGEERELLRILGTQAPEALLEHRHRLVPGDRLELGGAPLRPRLAAQRLGQRPGEYCFMIPELPLAQITPLFSG